MRTQGTYLAGLGVHRPSTVSVQSAVERGELTAQEARASGMASVAVAGATPAPELALRAAQDAMKNSGLSASDISLLVYTDVWHQGPDGWQPQYHLQRQLLGDDLLAVELRHGCSGVFSALELAVPHLRTAGDGRAALITAGDNFGSPLINRWNPGEGSSYLGDGGAAVVVSRESGFAEVLSVCTATLSEMEQAHRAGEPMFPPGATVEATVDFGARAERFQREAIEDGAWVRLLLAHQRRNLECVQRALDEAGVRQQDVSRVLIHSMPRQAAASYLTILGFDLEQSSWGFSRTVGHLGAGDHLSALHHLLVSGGVAAGDRLLLCGFSPGVTYKAAVVRVLDPTGFRDRQEGS
ncbi:MAG: ketoacyl-ACP synthase III family protein [Catenulispora sp.]